MADSVNIRSWGGKGNFFHKAFHQFDVFLYFLLYFTFVTKNTFETGKLLIIEIIIKLIVAKNIRIILDEIC